MAGRRKVGQSGAMAGSRAGVDWVRLKRGGKMQEGKMQEIEVNPELVAKCGLYCGACRSYRSGKCPGCRNNAKATWCKVRTCCAEHDYSSCAQCKEYADPKDCKNFNNFIAKIFAVVFRSDRGACIEQIKRVGIAGHAQAMAESKSQTIKRGAASSR